MEYEKSKEGPSLYPTAPAPPPYSTNQYPPGAGTPYGQPYPPTGQPYPPTGQPYPPTGGQGYSQPSGYGAYPDPSSYGGPQQTTVVVMSPGVVHPTVIVAAANTVSMIGAIVLSCFVFWCCGLIIGLIAFVLAIVGNSSSSSGNTTSAIQLRNASYGVSIVGIVIGILTIVLLFTVGR